MPASLAPRPDPPSRAPGGLVRAVPAPLLVILSGLSSYVGAGFAVTLSALMPSATVAWWRITIGALVLLAWRRPWRRRWTGRALAVCAAFGIATATMNVLFYASIEHLPLGTAVSIEFVGPVVVALATGRGWRPRVAGVMALVGVAAIGGLGLDMSDAGQRVGVLMALAAGGAWAAYILTGRVVAGAGSGLDSLAVASVAGSLFYLPLAVTTAGAALVDVPTVLRVLGVALMSTVVPYVIDQVVLGRLRSDTFSLLQALFPATSLVVGVVMLAQLPNVWEVVGLVLVSGAVALGGTGGGNRVPGRRL
ncbi:MULTISPECIES: EamA family transporter [unclassified Actinomyces]|uniref:EamA family transporter n=1 Tax=unclassified Actinomyces TaxID=2609248 RepID=UPI002017A886|nr:EamA family transporter [Actinomyces sp. 187325]